MFATITVSFIGIFAIITAQRTQRSFQPLSQRVSRRLQRLWDDAHRGIREKKYLRAEKALLTILKFDEKNAAAYNRLGILYAKQKEFKDAIDCFEIASSIEPSASSLHNLGLIYYESDMLDKATQAFENALELEEDLAARHIAYAKVQEKLGNYKKVIEELSRAVELEPNKQTYTLLIEALLKNGNEEEADEARQKLRKMIAPSGKPKRIKQPRKVVM